MKIYVDLDHVDITEYTQIESGEYNTNKINFIFTPEYKDLVKVAIFGCKLDTDEPKFYKIYLSDDSCYLPSEVTTTSDVISIGVYAFNVENGELKLRYSPTPVKTIVYEGSFREEAENSSSPTPTEIEQIMSRIISLEELTSDLNTRVEALENKACDLDSIKEDVETLKSDVEGISGRLDTVESDIDDLEGDLANTYSKTEVNTLLDSKVDISTFTSSQNAQDEKIALAELILSQLPEVSDSGETISLSPTIEATMKINPKGQCKQATSILPSEYQQVEYIQSSGTQVINTNVVMNQDTKIEVVEQIIDLTAGQASYPVFGSRNIPIDKNKLGYWVSNTYTVAYNFGTVDTGFLSTTNAQLKHKITIDKENFTFNDITFTNTNNSDFETTEPGYILAMNQTNAPLNRGVSLKLYSFKIWNNNILQRDFIPCYRISDNVIGLYDLVGNQFYTNVGTGSFTKGNNVSIPNPNYPQDVTDVTGNNTIVISNNDNSKTQSFPLNLGNIHMSGIGNYEDYFYKNENKWYKKNVIIKLILNGNEETGWATGQGQGSVIRYEYSISGLITTTENASVGSIVSNYFKARSANQTYIGSIGVSFKNKGSSGLYFYDGTNNTLTSFKNWLNTHNTIVYAPLQTPSDTEITDNTLIEELENIYNFAKSYNPETNISQTNDSAPFKITASAFKKLS